MRILKALIVISYALISSNTYAALQIDINQGSIEPMAIAINQFSASNWDEKQLGIDLLDVTINDLQNSGLFRVIDKAAFLDKVSVDQELVQYHNWRKINAIAVVAGSISISQDDKMIIQFKIWDPYKELLIDGMEYKVDKKAWRRIAHKIADRIYQRLTGETGYFDSKIAALVKSNNKKYPQIILLDQDGNNLKTITDGKYLIMSPRFDYKNRRLIYTAYDRGTPSVYILDIERGWQRPLGNFKGASFAARFSPNGESVIMSMSQNMNTNIFEFNLNDSSIKKLTHDINVINTSPSYAPSGDKIVFTSNRAGTRQLYIMNSDGSEIQRISNGSGSYAEPVWSPRGDYIAFTKMEANTFYIGVMRPDGSGERLLTMSWLDESPTWSPNGRVIMFSRKPKTGVSKLYSIDVTGYNERMVPTETSAYNPCWSNILK